MGRYYPGPRESGNIAAIVLKEHRRTSHLYQLSLDQD